MRPQTVTIYRVDRFTCTSLFIDIRSSPNRVISEVVPRSSQLKQACGAEIPSYTGEHYSYDKGSLLLRFEPASERFYENKNQGRLPGG